jgi:hypothetical protein
MSNTTATSASLQTEKTVVMNGSRIYMKKIEGAWVNVRVIPLR